MSLSIYGPLIPYHAFAQTCSFLSEYFFRHVHGFLEEIGQGVQHIASRVDDIISFVQEANDRRKIFGEVSTHVMLQVSLYLLIHIPPQSTCVLVRYSLGLHISQHTSKLLRCLDKRDATKRS